MTLIVTSEFELNRVVAPRLPTAPPEYEKRYHDQFADVLRLYFNRLDNILGQLVATMETLPVEITGTNLDAFGRLRVSNPFTLFDSSHRYADNNLWATSTTGTAAATFSADEGLVNLTVGTASGDQIIRETIKVFSYQPGKSLLVMSTFVMGTAKAGLRQRVGYYGAANGIYFERDGTTNYMVERSSVTGAVVNTRVAQADWNQDPMDGTGPSGLTLDSSKAQILYMDVEWLGLGTVRTGFIINGQFVPCHNFDHANLVSTTYITTASLPMRYEMENTAATGSASTLKQVCSTVISEGGYQLAGAQLSVGNPITSPTTLTTGGTYYPGCLTSPLKHPAGCHRYPDRFVNPWYYQQRQLQLAGSGRRHDDGGHLGERRYKLQRGVQPHRDRIHHRHWACFGLGLLPRLKPRLDLGGYPEAGAVCLPVGTPAVHGNRLRTDAYLRIGCKRASGVGFP